MKVLTLQTGLLGVNTFIIGTKQGAQCAVIDPGGDVEEILATCDGEDWRITHILLTHGHFDHIGGVKQLREMTEAKVYIHPADADMLTDAAKNMSDMTGLPAVQCPPDFLLQDGDVIEMEGFKLYVLHTPGHSLGGVSLYTPGLVFTGDTLMKLSVGRTDFPGGSMRELLRSIADKLLPLPDDTVVFPGHGGASTIGYERVHNSYIPLAK